MSPGTQAVTLSVGIPNFGTWAAGDWRCLLDVARAAEAAGVHRLIVNDHVVLGGNLDAYTWGRFPTAPDGPWLEPLSVLTAIAAVTERIRLATGILIAPLRPATVLAKTVATLDVLSAGRVDLGVGVGWQREEYDAAGLPFAERGRLLDDTVAACRALWAQQPASYSSETVSFEDVWCSPLPAQERLPVWFSGTLNERNLRRIVSLGDGWIPIMGATLDDIRAGAERLRGATDRPVAVQAPVPRTGFAALPDLIDAGVTDAYVYLAAFARTPAEAPEALHRIADDFRAAAR